MQCCLMISEASGGLGLSLVTSLLPVFPWRRNDWAALPKKRAKPRFVSQARESS